ncbi:hypothetical protein HF846_04915 [Clostridium cadaveris]|uniref:VanZ family protein n=1 Tax=Clostridium cadaveris TaxID=1529 RepID=UPI0014592CB5|nr:VanZ family protein [Clostridium cadaveris]NME63944.1 hypothetical protein [Clostridium cadaveris]UFH65826.1 VanZ family protein [Clostridium cadaveris]
MNNVKKILKNTFLILFSIIISFFIYRFITINLLDFIPFVITNKIPLYISIVLVQSIIIFIILLGIINNKLDSFSKKLLWLQYFIILLFLLFGRNIGFKGVELNILNSSKSWLSNSYNVVITIANLLMYMPLSLNFTNKNPKKIIPVMLFLIIIFESIQYMLSLGVFDVGDIILNIIGFIIGLKVFKSKSMTKLKNIFQINKE